MKNVIKQILLIMLVFMTVITFMPNLDGVGNVYAADYLFFTVNDFSFEVDTTDDYTPAGYDGSVILSSYNGYNTEIVIPASVTYDGKTYAVTKIGDSALSYGQSVLNVDANSIIIPDTVREIFEMAFASTSITSIELPDQLMYIDDYAFDDTDLTSVEIPATVWSVGENAFTNCMNLKDIYVERTESFSIYGDRCFGYYATDYSGVNYALVDGVTIHGYPGSAIETYAHDNGISFDAKQIKIKEINITSSSNTPPEYGDAISQPTFDISDVTPAGAKLQIDNTNSGWTNSGWMVYSAGDKVDDIKVGLQMRIMPESGSEGYYDFSETQIFINGEELEVSESNDYALIARRSFDVHAVQVYVFTRDLGSSSNSMVSLDGTDYSSQWSTYVKKDGTLDLYAQPDENSYFVEWRDDYNGNVIATTPHVTVTVDQDTEYWAVFEKAVTPSGELTATTEYTFDEATGTVTISKKADAEYGDTRFSSLGSSPFYGSSKIKHVVFEEGIQFIGQFTFENCIGIEDITIPASVVSIDWRAFEDCFLCGSGFDVDTENETYKSMNGSLFSKDGKTMYHFVQAKGVKQFTIPDGVKEVSPQCFNNVDLDKLTLKGEDLRLFDYALDGGRIDQVVIEEGVKDIGDYSSFTWAETSLSIPSTVTYIGTQTIFLQSEKLTEIHVADGNTTFKSMDGVLYRIKDDDKLALVRYPSAKAGSSFTTPAGVTEIQFNAFANSEDNKELTDIILSEEVNKVDYGAFRYTYNTTVTFLDPECVIDNSAFMQSNNIVIKALTGSTAEGVAHGLGIPFESLGASLGKLDAPTNLRWDGYTVLWNAVPDASRYEVFFFYKDQDGSESSNGPFVVTEPSFTYSTSEHDAFWWKTSEYWVTVSAVKAGYEPSEAAVSPKINGMFTYQKPAAPKITGNVMSWPAYTDEGLTTGCLYWLGVKDKDGNLVDAVNSTWLYDGKTSIDLAQLFESKGVGYGDYTLSYCAWINYDKWSLILSDVSDEVQWHYGKDISGAEVTLAATSYTYSGAAKKPAATVVLDGVALQKDVDYAVSYTNNTNAGTATAIITGQGTYGGEVKATFTIKPKAVTPTVTLNATSVTYNGKSHTPKVTVKAGSTKLTTASYTVTYASGRKNVGKYKITVKLKGNYSGSASVYFKINPKGTTLATSTAASKAITVKWNKQSAKMATARISGYQIQLATNSGFTKNKKTVNVSGYSTVSKKVTSLKRKTKYYIRIRTYKTISGTKYYSPWSKVKTVTTKA